MASEDANDAEPDGSDLSRLAAYSLHHALTPMGDYFRRMKSKTGTPLAATTAAAHKIAIVFYTLVS